MRRMSGRTPPFAIIGVIVIGLFLFYNLWTLSSHNEVLTHQLEKLQIEIKVCATKQTESDKSTSLLQEHIVELQTKIEDSKKYAEENKSLMKKTGNELSNLKNKESKLHKMEEDLKQELEAKDAKIIKAEKKLELTVELKDEAELVIAEKDQLINKLQQQLEQTKRDLHIAYAQESDGQLNIVKYANNSKKEPYTANGSLKDVAKTSVLAKYNSLNGNIEHPGLDILPQQSPNAIRSKPKFSITDASPSPQKSQDNQVQVPNVEHGDIMQLNNVQNVIPNPEALKHEADVFGGNALPPQQVIQKPVFLPEINNHDPISAVLNEPPKAGKQDNDMANVIPLPPQNLAENPDTAIDEEEKNLEDPADDQDEEGKEIKHDLEAMPGGDEEGKKNFDEFNNNIDYEEDNERNGLKKHAIPKDERPEPRGIGLMQFPRSKNAPVGDDYVNFDGEQDRPAIKANANERLYGVKFPNKIRNIGKI